MCLIQLGTVDLIQKFWFQRAAFEHKIFEKYQNLKSFKSFKDAETKNIFTFIFNF